MPAVVVTDAASIASCYLLHSCYNQSFAFVEKTTYDSMNDSFAIIADTSLVDLAHVRGLTLAS